ncbi:hypothetical protein BV22DRAFT_1024825, partial [Leucogyrophana mollusca]
LNGHIKLASRIVDTSDGHYLVSGFQDKIRIWNVHTGETVGSPLEGHSDCIGSQFALPPDGRMFAGSALCSSIRIWDANIGECVADPLGPIISHSLVSAYRKSP